jgi:division protein CdvB (Snf7/Vps24/ESCRT-III family)
MIELKKIAPEDSLEVNRLKDEFNRYAMQMRVQWQDLSLEEKQILYDKLRKVEIELSKYE